MYGTETTGWLDVELPVVCMVQKTLDGWSRATSSMYGTETTGWLDVALVRRQLYVWYRNHWMVGCRATSSMYGTETTGRLDVELTVVCMVQKPLDGWM